MKKNEINLRSLCDKYQSNCDRINAIADACEQEKRERTEAENAEYQTLARENQLIEMRMKAASDNYQGNAVVDASKLLRENVAVGRQTEIRFFRSAMVVSDATSGGIIPVRIQDFVKPLEEGTIYDKVGLPFRTGLAGDFVWPLYEAVEASIIGEGVALSDTKINLNKLTPSPERMGIAIAVSKEAINQTEGVIENLVKVVMPDAVKALIDKILMSTTKVNDTTSLEGPMVNAASHAVALSSTPTFAELNGLKASLLQQGVEGSAMCWVMSKAQEAILEGVPINSNGIYRPIAENHMMCGLPIFTSNHLAKKTVVYYKYTAAQGSTPGTWGSPYTLQDGDVITYTVAGDSAAHALAKVSSPEGSKIAKVTVIEEYIGIGDWRYQPAGLFGNISLVVDPYSQARKNCVDFVLNTDFATKTLKVNAFAAGKVAVASD